MIAHLRAFVTHWLAALPPVHSFVAFCFQFRYWLFKTHRYLNNRKVAEAVSRSLSTP